MKRYLLLLMSLIGWTCWTFAATETASYPLQASTFSHVSSLEAVHDVRVSRHTVSFKLDDPIWQYMYNQNPINFVGSKAIITSITLPDIATNTANLRYVPSVTLLNADGKEIATSKAPTTGTLITLSSIDGSHVDAIPYTYTFDKALELDTQAVYTLRLNPDTTQLTTPPVLAVFRNASSEYTDADTSIVRIDGSAEGVTPYLAIDGSMTMTRFFYDYDLTAGTHSLDTLLTKDGFTDANDTMDTMVVLRLKAMDTVVEFDRNLTQAATIVATDTPATTWEQEQANTDDWAVKQRAGTVRFLPGTTFTGPWDFRDVSDSTTQSEIRMIRLEYNGDTSPVIPRKVWNPEDFALSCDLELSAYPDMTPETKEELAWFGRNPITIPSGRSVRIVTHVNEANVPKITFADATSRLALAIPTNEPHVLSHYRELIENNSGILRMVSPFAIQTQSTDTNTEHPISLILGVDDDATTAPSVQTIESYNTTTFKSAFVLGYGVENKAQYVQHAGEVSIGGEGLFIGQKNPALAKYFLKNGKLTTDRVTFGHQAHDAALIVGDGEGEANSAVANLSQLLASDVSSTTEITGTAEVIINADGQLVLNGDFNMTPAQRRRMTLNGGTLKAMGANPAYTFGTDFTNGGGLAVSGNAVIDASKATPLFRKSAVDADMKMEFEGNNDIVVKDTNSAWFTTWSGNWPESYVETPSGKGFIVSDSVKPYTGATLPTKSDYTIAIGVNMDKVTATNAVIFSVGSWDNALALRKKDATTVEVVHFGEPNWTATVDASYTSESLRSGWHLFVVSVDNDIHVDITTVDGKEVLTETVTATKITLMVDNVPTTTSTHTPFIFGREWENFQIGAAISNQNYGAVAVGMHVDNCYIWERALTIAEARALRPTLTIDAITGGSATGSLTIDGTVSIDHLGNFKGLIQAAQPSTEEANDGGNIRIGQLSGVSSDITIGYLGRRDTSVVADILALTHKEGVTPYRGTLGFSADNYPLVDISQTEELDIYAQIRIQNGQTLRIRLDQFADATILWPETIDETNPPKLEIVEAGAYGGNLQIPHLPEIIADNLVFYHYDHNNLLVPHDKNSWKIEPEENGAYDNFEWEYPNFSHYSAWIDAEFEGNSYNTGWMRVGKLNALLKGTDWYENGSNWNDWGSVMTEDKFFTDTRNPAGKGVKLCYRPYIELTDLTYPKVWSAAIRLTAPRKSNTTILALSSTCGGAYYPKLPDGDALILATGDNVPAAGPIPIVLYHAIDNAATGDTYNAYALDTLQVVASATIADISEIPHVISAVCDGKRLTVYLDGGLLTEYPLPENWVGLATGGLQVGQVLSGSSNTGDLTRLQSANPEDGGYVDYIRFYKGALTAKAMQALAEEAPPVHQGVRYIRHVTEDGDWEYPINGEIEPWIKQTWDGSAWNDISSEARPSEGAEIRLFVKGARTLKVNTEADPSNGFLSANRFYSALNVLPHAEADASTTSQLTLLPIDGEVTLTNKDAHPWMTQTIETSTSLGKVWKYGSIKFVGGGEDTIHPAAACEAEAYDNPSAALGVHGRRAVGTSGGTPEAVSDNIAIGAESAVTKTSTSRWQKTRTVTQTRLYRRNFTGGDVASHLIPSAGVIQFSRLAGILIGGVPTTTGTEVMTATRTITQTQTGFGNNKNNITWSNTWEPAYAVDTDDNWSQWHESDWTTETIADGATLIQAKLELHADYTLIRDRENEESALLHLTGKIGGRGLVIGNPEIEQPNLNGQVSTRVWVPVFEEGANWLLSDVTETIYGTGSNPSGTVNGLLAQIRQIPGRLYLDLGDAEFVDGSIFFTTNNVPWYRYGYKDDDSASPKPVKASPNDLETAIAFQIRVPAGTVKTIHANGDILAESRRLIATLRVESDNTNTNVPTLKLTTTPENGNIFIDKQLITSIRLEDIGEAPAGDVTNNTSSLVIAESALIHGHTTGTYAFRNTTWKRALVNDSIATLEAHGENNHFEGNFELRNTHLVIANNAILEQTETNNHLWAKSLTMGENSVFRFHAAGPDEGANGVVFSGNVTLLGNATLHGYGQVDQDNGTPNATRCNFTAAQFVQDSNVEKVVLTVNSENINSVMERWICYTSAFSGTNFGLTKLGGGIMAFRSPTPPTVTGPVNVNEGILRVGTTPVTSDVLNEDKHAGTSIGHHGLHVAAGAALEPNHYANGEDLIACIPSGQTLSGTGTIDGLLRLNSGARLEDCAGMTIRKMVVDGSTLPDIKVTLPTDIAERAILFHMLNDSARGEVRRRFYATRNGERWDVVVNHKAGVDGRNCQSHYLVYKPGVPVPTNPNKPANNTFGDAMTATMTHYYQGYNVARLWSTCGYTKITEDSSYKLNAAEIENAFNCFSHVWTFDKDEAQNTLNSVYVDDEASFLMAYEFGITRMDVRDIGETRYLIVEVKVENALGKAFGNHVTGANNVADFQLNTQVAFYRVHEDEKTTPTLVEGVQEIVSFDATDLTKPSEHAHTPGIRAFAIPFDEDRFPMGTTSLSVKVSL